MLSWTKVTMSGASVVVDKGDDVEVDGSLHDVGRGTVGWVSMVMSLSKGCTVTKGCATAAAMVGSKSGEERLLGRV